jgi:uncharacterized Zn-finger protein
MKRGMAGLVFKVWKMRPLISNRVFGKRVRGINHVWKSSECSAMVRAVLSEGSMTMAYEDVPHFHNTDGVAQIEIGTRTFMCIGALPPFDHPHVFLDMGDSPDIVCPYCSTHYVFNSRLAAGSAVPASAVFQPQRAELP